MLKILFAFGVVFSVQQLCYTESVKGLQNGNAIKGHSVKNSKLEELEGKFSDTWRTDCPPNYTGVHSYEYDCRQFLNCFNGRGVLQNCPPGTLFNGKSLICDYPYRVQCANFDHLEDESIGAGSEFAIKRKCLYNSGLFEHPNDYGKFVHCSNGIAFIQDCPAGTVFNKMAKICDWPRNVPIYFRNRDTIYEFTTQSAPYENIQPRIDVGDSVESRFGTDENYDSVIEPKSEPSEIIESRREYSVSAQKIQSDSIDDDLADSIKLLNNYTKTSYTPSAITPVARMQPPPPPPPPQSQSSSSHTEFELIDKPIINHDLSSVQEALKFLFKPYQASGSNDNNNETDPMHKLSELMAKNFVDAPKETILSEVDDLKAQKPNNVSDKSELSPISSVTAATTTTTNVEVAHDNYFNNMHNVGINEIEKIFDCENDFNCNNGKCISYEKVCDGRNDCDNRFDEIDCKHIGYEIRLSTENGTTHMGRVEVKVHGMWGYICEDGFDMNDANVLCKEVGFPNGAARVIGDSYYLPHASMVHDNRTIFMMDGVNCNGNESTLQECDFNGWGIHDCNTEEVVGVECKLTNPNISCPMTHLLCETSHECIPYAFLCDNVVDCEDNSDEDVEKCRSPVEFRLADGTTSTEGRLEVRYQGIWGTICDDDFGYAEAKVACRSLGFYGQAAILNNTYGEGLGPIWLDQVSCRGNETKLTDCLHQNWNEHNCVHSEDISIRCSDGNNSEMPIRIKTRKPAQTEKIVNKVDTHCGIIMADDEDYVEEGPTFRVIGGNVARKGYHPWQATLRIKGRNGKSSHWCGAVLITNRHLITAAHCLEGFSKGSYFIRLADYNSEEVEQDEIEVFIEDWFIHEEFRKVHRMNNDIAIIVIKHPIQYSKYIQPICLPEKSTEYLTGQNCTISGWGSIKFGKSTPSLQLRSATIPLISDEICKMPDVYGGNVTEQMFCAGFLDEVEIDSCEGDSGSPLVCQDNGYNTLYGIVSWGHRCGKTNKPGVYVKIIQYIDWIQEKLENMI